MTFDDDALNRLVSEFPWEPDWSSVLERAGERQRPRPRVKRRLILILAVLAAVLIPLIALAAGNERWLLK